MENIIIDNINTHLKVNGIKQTWISEMIDMDPSMLNDILTKKTTNIDIDILLKIADTIDVSLYQLFDIDYSSKLQNKMPYADDTNSIIEFYTEGLNKKEAAIVENIITAMDIIAVFKEANRNYI